MYRKIKVFVIIFVIFFYSVKKSLALDHLTAFKVLFMAFYNISLAN